MTYTVLTYGDSNTFGTPPMGSFDQHPRILKRWPSVMADSLKCNLIEDGLPGRLAAGHGDPNMGAYMDGQLGLRIALASHGPIDLLTIMLGTNDLKADLGKTAPQIASHIDALIKIAQTADLQDRHGGFEILVICPAPVIGAGVFAADFEDSVDISRALPALFTHVATRRGVHFLDTGVHIASSDIDGIHFDEATHTVLGQVVADQIKTILI
jgi:lysophospholipase L1-like esterase